MSTLTAEEVALQESQSAIEAEEKAAAEKQAALEGDQSGAAKVEPKKEDQERAVFKSDEEVAAEAKAEEERVAAERVSKEKKKDPVDAIIAFRRQNQELLAENLRLQGENSAYKSVASKPAAEAEVEVDPLAGINAKREALAEQADSGDITLAEMRRQDMVLEQQAREIEIDRAMAKHRPANVQTTDLALDYATSQLGEEYPILNELSVAELAPFKDVAYAQAAREGRPIQPGPLGTLDLRTRMAQLATRMYGGEVAVAAKGEAKDDPAAKAREDALRAKVELQAGMPPDATKIGSGNTQVGMSETELTARMLDPNLTYAEAEKLTASLSPALRQKLGL